MKTGSNLTNEQRLQVQSAWLFSHTIYRPSIINSLGSALPKRGYGDLKDKSYERQQTSSYMPIVRVSDLGVGKGDEAKFDVLKPVNTYPTMGDQKIEGRGVGLQFGTDRVRLNLARFAIDAGSLMTEHRSKHNLKETALITAGSLMRSYLDDSTLVHMAGARGYQNNSSWSIPLQNNPKFAEIMVNDVRAPSRSRHYIVKASGVAQITDNSGSLGLQTTDLFSMDTVDSMKAVIDEMTYQLPYVQLEDDPMAMDSPFRVWLVSPMQYNLLQRHKDFRTYQSNAHMRGNKSGGHPLFTGEVGLWNGFVIKKMPKSIRFFAGDEMKYCKRSDSTDESSIKVDDSLGANFAVDRSIILGGQALVEAFGEYRNHNGGTRNHMFFNKVVNDHGNALEVAAGVVRGISKIRFDMGPAGASEYVDYGIAVVDSVVPIIAGMN